VNTAPDNPYACISSCRAANWRRKTPVTQDSGHDAAGAPMLVGRPGNRSRPEGNGSTPPYSPIIAARRSGWTVNGPE
jgi:hypothetical protein